MHLMRMCLMRICLMRIDKPMNSKKEDELLYTVWSLVMVREPVTSARGNRVLYGLANVSGPRTFVARSWFTVSSTDEVKAMIEAGVECKETEMHAIPGLVEFNALTG
ncbi:hypothetical protein WN51_03224 [Melipona quadrifasciata]|uniref:Uncharacterized protein n=1 Tax=Melipona quadrifasciata TaxID=166423 RepID=A0A0M8ZVS1_9HYME|nr:hypothetical protein WN51_03224 [Melipona quadrifasciata]